MLEAISRARHEERSFQSLFAVHDVVFCRVSHNPVFCMHTVNATGFVLRASARIHMLYVGSWLEGQQEPLERVCRPSEKLEIYSRCS